MVRQRVAAVKKEGGAGQRKSKAESGPDAISGMLRFQSLRELPPWLHMYAYAATE
jgi:hypothetical protein